MGTHFPWIDGSRDYCLLALAYTGTHIPWLDDSCDVNSGLLTHCEHKGADIPRLDGSLTYAS